MIAWIVIIAFYLFAIIYNLCQLIDPVKTAIWEKRVWWRLPSDQKFTWRPDVDELRASSRKRLNQRLGAAAFIALLLAVGYVILSQIRRGL